MLVKKEYELPKTFDEFMEERQQGFLRVKEYKENGGKMVGILCSYTPYEIIDAAGAAAIALCGMSDEPIPDAEKHLPKNLCPLIKSTYGFAITETCPFTYFADMIIAETTCDGKKKMYELLGDLKPVHIMQLPQGQGRPYASDIWYEECKLLKEKLEEIYDVKITDEDLRKSVRKYNEYNKAMMRLFELQGAPNSPLTGTEVQLALLQNSFSFNIEEQTRAMNNRADEIEKIIANAKSDEIAKGKRILITGCPTTGVIQKVGGTIEAHGGNIVCNDNCGGETFCSVTIDPDSDDILRAISDRYLAINCSVMTPNESRIRDTKELIEKYEVDGVVEVILQACHTFNIEAEQMRRLCEGMGVPYMKIETDYSENDAGQLNTRVAAFLEMV